MLHTRKQQFQWLWISHQKLSEVKTLWNNTFKVFKEKNYQAIILCPRKIYLKNDSKDFWEDGRVASCSQSASPRLQVQTLESNSGKKRCRVDPRVSGKVWKANWSLRRNGRDRPWCRERMLPSQLKAQAGNRKFESTETQRREATPGRDLPAE